MAKAMFGAGCFWGVEERFRQIAGVSDVAVGYSGGTTDNPTYEQVCSGATGHAEVVEVAFDPAKVSYETLLETFFDCHDATQVNRQGPDVGTQYRSAIFTYDEDQLQEAQRTKAALTARGVPVATEVTPASPFWRAEEYHQQYIAKRKQRMFGGLFR
jgi:peptide-methionine (S)-S-oxide reductase